MECPPQSQSVLGRDHVAGVRTPSFLAELIVTKLCTKCLWNDLVISVHVDLISR
jgi:hypothetical protein